MHQQWTVEEEKRVGDWHGNRAAAQHVLAAIKDLEPGLRTVLHVGDFGLGAGRLGKGMLLTIDRICESIAIEQILATPGNHDNWERLDHRFAARPGRAIKWSEHVWVLPRGHRFRLGDRTVLSFGGAVSVDLERRTEGRDWWQTEARTDDDVDLAIKGGSVDLMISHDSFERGTSQVREGLEKTASRWPREAIEDSALSRHLLTQVWDAVRLKVLMHGHSHVQGEITLAEERRVYSIGQELDRGNAALLDLADLSWTWIR